MDDAVRLAREARKEAEQSGDQRLLVEALDALGAVLHSARHHDESEAVDAEAAHAREALARRTVSEAEAGSGGLSLSVVAPLLELVSVITSPYEQELARVGKDHAELARMQEEANGIFGRLEAIFEHNGVTESSDYARYLRSKAWFIAGVEGRPKDAAELQRRAITVMENLPDVDQRRVGHQRSILASFLRDAGEHDLAIAEFQSLTAEREDQSSDPLKSQIAGVLYEAGRVSEAAEILQDVHRSRGSTFPDRAYLNIPNMEFLADCLFELGRYQEAAEVVQDAIQAMEAAPGIYVTMMKGMLHGKLADCHAETGDLKQCEEHARKSLELIAEDLGEVHCHTLTAIYRLLHCLIERGQSDDVDELMLRGADVCLRLDTRSLALDRAVAECFRKLLTERSRHDLAGRINERLQALPGEWTPAP